MPGVKKFKRKLFIRIGISTGVIFLFVIFIILLNKDINKRVEVITNYKTETAMRTQLTNQLAHLRKEVKEADVKLATLADFLPSRDELIIFPKELERIARENKVDFGFSFGNEVAAPADEPSIIRFSMSLAGTLSNLLSFLRALEAERYFINLSSVDFDRKNGDIFALLTNGEVYIRSLK